MKNNFIQMATSAGHVVAYTIDPIFKHIIDCVHIVCVLLKPNVADILLFNFCEHKFVQHGLTSITIDWPLHCLLIFEEKWSNYAKE